MYINIYIHTYIKCVYVYHIYLYRKLRVLGLGVINIDLCHKNNF